MMYKIYREDDNLRVLLYFLIICGSIIIIPNIEFVYLLLNDVNHCSWLNNLITTVGIKGYILYW